MNPSCYRHMLNGQVVNEDELLVSPRDLGFIRGYGVFDSLITVGGIPFRLDLHIERLYSSAEQICLTLPWNAKVVASWVYEVLKANDDGKDKHVKIMITGGQGSDSLTPSKDKPTAIVIVDPRPQYPAQWYKSGISVATMPHTRYSPTAKSISYLAGVLSLQKAKAQGHQEVLFYDSNQVFEGVTSSVFAVIDGQMLTPKTNVLRGVTRSVILETLPPKLPVYEKDFSLNQLKAAQEAYICSTTRGIIPLIAIDSVLIGDGQVGPMTRKALDAFERYVSSGQWHVCNKCFLI